MSFIDEPETGTILTQWDGEGDRRKKPYANITGFATVPRTWSDVVSVMTVFAMAIAGLMWGLKLDDRQQDITRDIAAIQSVIAKGVLPLTEERITVMSQRLADLTRTVERLNEKLDQKCTPEFQWRKQATPDL